MAAREGLIANHLQNRARPGRKPFATRLFLFRLDFLLAFVRAFTLARLMHGTAKVHPRRECGTDFLFRRVHYFNLDSRR